MNTLSIQNRGQKWIFDGKSQILFPFDYAKKRLKRYIPENVEIECVDPEPEPLDLGTTDHHSGDRKQPIIAVMGHQDHGKTTLLDAIRGTNFAETESGGITQRVSCIHYKHSGARNPFTFIDTPGEFGMLIHIYCHAMDILLE